MAVQLEVSRTPDELAADLAELSAVDWSQVWLGPMGADLTQWCAKFGWRLESLTRDEYGMFARLGPGGTIYVRQDQAAPYPHPVKWVDMHVWRASAESAADHGDLFVAIDEAWPNYLARARQAIGEPVVLSSWDDPNFPLSTRWPDREKRLRYRRPYRLAVWSVPGTTIELDPAPSDNATSPSMGGGINLLLAVRPIETPGG